MIIDSEVVKQIQDEAYGTSWRAYFDYGALRNIPFYQDYSNIGTQAYCCKDFVISGMVNILLTNHVLCYSLVIIY